MNEDQTPVNDSKPRQPSVGRVAVPVWIFIVALLLGYRGCVHVDRAGGAFAFNGSVYGPYRTPKEIDGVQPSTGGINDVVRKGRVNYNNVCSGCHQPSGAGSPGQFPPLVGSEWVLDAGPNRIIRIVLHGLQGPLTVAGKQFNGAMVGFGSVPTMTDEDIAAILTYIKNSKEWGQETGQIVTPEQVKAVREATAARTAPFTMPELLQVPVL